MSIYPPTVAATFQRMVGNELAITQSSANFGRTIIQAVFKPFEATIYKRPPPWSRDLSAGDPSLLLPDPAQRSADGELWDPTVEEEGPEAPPPALSTSRTQPQPSDQAPPLPADGFAITC